MKRWTVCLVFAAGMLLGGWMAPGQARAGMDDARVVRALERIADSLSRMERCK
jgi:hypothetical protein